MEPRLTPVRHNETTVRYHHQTTGGISMSKVTIVDVVKLAHETENYREENGMKALVDYREAALELGAPEEVAGRWDMDLRQERWDCNLRARARVASLSAGNAQRYRIAFSQAAVEEWAQSELAQSCEFCGENLNHRMQRTYGSEHGPGYCAP